MNKKGLEDLVIYKQYIELIYYTNMILKKFPKIERYALATDIKNNTNEGIKCIIRSYKEFNKTNKIKELNTLDVNLKYLKVLVRISFKNKYINVKNYEAWSRKLFNIGNLVGKWIITCRKR